MRSIIDTCKPRSDILEGTFNPEIFTASLSQVMNHYRGRPAGIHNLYTDAESFFAEGTYPTEGMLRVLRDVFGRIAGRGAPGVHRLETAFGGGKTHILIALAHIAFRGHELSSVVGSLLGDDLLPKPGEVRVVGIAGDEIPVRKPKGTDLVPYTLWGEIAYQIGGEGLYRQVEDYATSFEAPDAGFFRHVFEGRKVLILLDELAQYATRLEAAHPQGNEQLAAFLMPLFNYMRTHTGIAAVVSLAGESDAFSRQTEILRKIVCEVRGEDVSDDEALGLAHRADSATRSVLARDATTVVPVRSGEISKVLAKRLFETIDADAGRMAAAEYLELYGRHRESLPDRVSLPDFHKELESHYPFHPAFIDFLNNKLATLETFQGTRGVLRVLALTVRSIWRNRLQIPMIHTCHVDFMDTRTLDEIIGRTGSSDLLPIINADIGGPDTRSLETGRSQAELVDQQNPHPLGYPLHQYTWKTVFLHSLVGRGLGLGSNLFGITRSQVLYEVSFPGLSPPQVETALEAIREHALYLRFERGRYFASLDPSENIALAGIRRSLKDEQVMEVLVAAARKVVTSQGGLFKVCHDVSAPEHLPDHTGRPVLAMIAIDTREIDVEAFLTSVGPNRPRIQQNLVFLLVPNTVHVKGEVWGEDRVLRARESLNKLKDAARWVLAMRELKRKPENYGIKPSGLSADFESRHKERELALQTSLAKAYDSLWFPSASGRMLKKEIRTAGGEGGFSTVEEIRRLLINEGELIPTDRAATQETLLALKKLFFASAQTPTLKSLRENFACRRDWPILDHPSPFDTIIREGVSRGVWVLFRMTGVDSSRPEELYSSETGELPLTLDLSHPDWCLVTMKGARQREWIAKTVDPGKVKEWVRNVTYRSHTATVADLIDEIRRHYGEVPEDAVSKAAVDLLKSEKLLAYRGKPQQEDKPQILITGQEAIIHRVRPDDVLITRSEASKRGWTLPDRRQLVLDGEEAVAKVVPLLPRLGSLYSRGASSTIKILDIWDLEIPSGGRLRIQIEDASAESMKRLGELFEIVAEAVHAGTDTQAFMEIDDPDDSCLLIKTLKKNAD